MTKSLAFDRSAEWLEADGLGGFASGTVDGIRTRRYHAVLLVALRPPTDRVALVNGFDVWVETPAGQFSLGSNRYIPDVVHPDGARRLSNFTPHPWPTWTFRLEDGTEIIAELMVPRDMPVALASWKLGTSPGATRPAYARLLVRPLLACRDAHSLHLANPSFRFDAEEDGEMIRWHPYHGIPGVVAVSNGEYSHDPVWYHGFLYTDERERGLDCTEDLASPGALRWDLCREDAALLLTTDSFDLPLTDSASVSLERLREQERVRRERLGSRLLRSADAFLVRRGHARTILAGYPWSTAWGRDTFVALRGLCIAGGRLDDARQILLGWSDHLSGGLFPNHFADRLDRPEFSSVDASLWFVVAVYEYMQAVTAAGQTVTPADCAALRAAVHDVLSACVAGTRFGIRLADDGLLAAGEPGTPASWMDARLGEWVVTPRVGKPVEIQALWLNALRIGSHWSTRWQPLLERGLASFADRFWYQTGAYLYDVIDVDHRAGAVDPSFRPNQILAIGGLPFPLLGGLYARRVVDMVEARLWTPLGLRTLAPDEAGYVARYDGNARHRESVAHQGPVWPWLLGPFVEAWVRVRGNTVEARRQARDRFLAPLYRHLDDAGLGHVSELADAEPPQTSRGSPFQAWSLGELIRLSLVVLAEPVTGADPAPSASSAILTL